MGGMWLKALVLAGGHGTRLRPLTYGFAKQLIPIANKPVLFYALDDLKNAGITEVIVNVAPHSKDEVMKALGDGSAMGLSLQYSLQEEPLGIAHAIKIAKHMIGDDSFVVYLGDNILTGGIRRYVEYFKRSSVDAMVLTARVKNPERFGTVEVGDKNRVVRVVEKPKNPTSDLAMVGVYLLRPNVFESIDRLKKSWRNELEIVDAYQDMIDRGRLVEAASVDGWWADTGTPEDLFEANRLLLDRVQTDIRGRVEEGSSVEGRVVIGEGSTLQSGAVVRGPSIIGRNCKIGSRVYIGPYSSIGDGTEIVSGELENSIIMEGCRIDCNFRITDSILGREVIIDTRNGVPRGMKLLLGQKSYVTI